MLKYSELTFAGRLWAGGAGVHTPAPACWCAGESPRAEGAGDRPWRALGQEQQGELQEELQRWKGSRAEPPQQGQELGEGVSYAKRGQGEASAEKQWSGLAAWRL